MDRAGVNAIFSLSGNQIMPIYDALIEYPIRLVHARHEAAAVFMAEAYAQASGGFGVALVAAGPGFGNALGPLYSAFMSETALVLLSGDSPVGLDGRDAFQEFDQVAAASPFVKDSSRLSSEEDPAEALCRAIRIARSGIPGPVHLALPFDLIDSAVSTDLLQRDESPVLRLEPELETPPLSQLERLTETLWQAARPLVLVGPHLGRANNGQLVENLSSSLHIPVVTLVSPRGLRDPALGSLAEVLAVADCVLYLGKPVDFTSGFAGESVIPVAKILLVTGQPETIDRARAVLGHRLVISEQADALAMAGALIEHIQTQDRYSTIRQARDQWYCEVDRALRHRALSQETADDLFSKAIVETIAGVIKEKPETVLVCDGGEFGQWAQAFCSAGIRIINGPAGAIGGSLPYAIGAKIAQPDVPVLAVMGDGTAGFHLAEFETAARESLGITVLVGNDSRWNAEHHIQLQNYGPGRTMGCTLNEDTRYDVAAQGLGCNGYSVSKPGELGGVLKQCLDSGEPGCINMTMPGAPAPQYSKYDIQNAMGRSQ